MDRGRPRKIRRMFWGLGTAGLVVMMVVLFIPRPSSNPQLDPENVPTTNPPTNPPPDLPLFQLNLTSPQENTTIIFPPGSHNYLMVNFTQANLTQVNLIINKTNYGSVTAGVPIDLTYNATLDGNVSLELQGYYQGEKVITTGYNCTFGKIESYTMTDVLDSGNLSVPAQLYFIIYDPPGDKSYSKIYYANETYNVGLESLEPLIGEPQVNPSLCASENFVDLAGISEEYDWQYKEEHNSGSMSSCLASNDLEFIGPCYGDSYYGVAWVLPWEIRQNITHYFNGTLADRFQLSYGLNGNGSYLVGPQYFPNDDWGELNPLNQNYPTFPWDQNLTFSGGGMYAQTFRDLHFSKINQTLIIETNASARQMYPQLPEFITTRLTTNFDGDNLSESITLLDDDSEDLFNCLMGFDPVYGTRAFWVNRTESHSAHPVEFNTQDYHPPIFLAPSIDLDPNGNDIAPDCLDSPVISATILDEIQVTSASIIYSTDFGSTWLNSAMLNTYGDMWRGTIPAMLWGTHVLWYLSSEDADGNQNDTSGNPLEYIVENTPPAIELLTPIPGESYNGSILFTWDASDADGDILNYTVCYSTTGPSSWILLVRNITDNYFLWDISEYPYEANVLVRVTADDGYGGVTHAELEGDVCITIEDLPTLSHPDDLSYVNNTPSPIYVTWTIFDTHPVNITYRLYVNGSVRSPVYTWNGVSPVQFNVFGFDVGTYLITLQVKEDDYCTITDDVILTVTES